MAVTLAYNLANLALATSNSSNVNVAVFAGNVTTVQFMNAGNITVGNVRLSNALVFSDGSSLTSVTNATQVFDYTGDGTTIAYSTGSYNATTTLNTQVYVSGVYQRKNTYSWTGTTLTFLQGAPPLNSNIEIVVNSFATGVNVPANGSVYPISMSTGAPTWDVNGNVGINTSSTPYSLVINDADGMLIPKGTTAQRPTPLASGLLRFNTSFNQFEGYNGTGWGSLGGAAGSSGDQIFWLNGNTITADYTVPVGSNAGTFGPVTINNTVTVTVSSGSFWSIV